MAEPSILGKRLKAWREYRGVSQNQLSMDARVPRSTIGQVEAGIQASMSIENLVKIADALQVTLDQLVRRDVSEKPLLAASA